MSTVTTVLNAGNQAHFDYDVSKIFVNNNRYNSATFLNGTGSTASFLPGTLIGRIAASGKITRCSAAATDGSQFPIGVLLSEITSLANAGEITATYCIAGDVVESKLLFAGSETLNSVVTVNDSVPDVTDYTRRLRDLIQQAGIVLVSTIELTDFDNQ